MLNLAKESAETKAPLKPRVSNTKSRFGLGYTRGIDAEATQTDVTKILLVDDNADLRAFFGFP